MSTDVAVKPPTDTSGRPRKTRPDGSLYSSDPKERFAQLKEDGKVGPQFGKLGGRPRKKRAAEIVAEHAQKKAQEIIQVFDDALSEDEPTRVRMEAAQALIRIERDEAAMQIEEDKLEEMSREDLAAALKEVLSDPQIAAVVGIGYTDVEYSEEEIEDAEVVNA